MRPDGLRGALLGGELVLGSFVMEFGTEGVARAAKAAGVDFLLLDLEHSGWSVERLRAIVPLAGAAGLATLVRAPGSAAHLISRPLDLGATGIVVPMVESSEQALAVAAAARYPPAGRRGVGVVDLAEGETLGAALERIAARTVVAVQIETAAGLEQVEAIAAVPGVDLLLVGGVDLTVSLGIPGDFEHERYTDALRAIAGACARSGKVAGTLVLDPAASPALVELGYGCLVCGNDLLAYERGLRAGIERIRALAAQ